MISPSIVTELFLTLTDFFIPVIVYIFDLGRLPYEPPRDKTNKVTVRPAKTQIRQDVGSDCISS